MRFTIGKKLFFGFLAVLIILAVTVVISYTQLTSIDNNYNNLINDKANKVILVQKLNGIIKTEQVSIRGYLITKDPEALSNFTKAHEEFVTASENLDSIMVRPEAKKLLKSVKESESEYFTIGNQQVLLKQQNKTDEYIKLSNLQGHQVITSLDKTIAELDIFQQKLLDQGNAANTKKVNSVKTWVLILGLIAIILGAIVAFIMGRMISKPIIKLVNVAHQIAKGDLTLEDMHVNNNDEIGDLSRSFTEMVSNLRQLIQQVKINAEQVAASSDQLSASAEETSAASTQIGETMQRVAQGVKQQVHTVEETSLSIGEMAIGIQQIADNSLDVSSSSLNASEKASEGEKTIDMAIQQMNSINETFTGLSNKLEGLGERSKEVGQIIELITSISAQTNLLALNAAIEAARAGEHGRGFAVVADEVRKLAEQSAESAQKISTLVSTMQKETEESIKTMDDATKEVIAGIEVVNIAGTSFGEIKGAINQVTTQTSEVSAAVQEIAASTEQMAQSITLITQIAETTSSGTDEVAVASQQQAAAMKEVTDSSNFLSNMAGELQQHIRKFTV
ncbi:methyl-accepting chemotaxis protein [Bacillus sp. ISL-18]|uniref:methyl-accepting chemotaxis protein n=1 Tax=Bacillus sp. ISL-18 TaxID=2819118 RepID=UPI001BEC19C4|nr:methyl-accepting chemotaxis protein [Bacillus sp. ISL-18]MBT2655280.1 methyl-accepting chemotaxis protein [Bacillus sp. ISL-18]